MKLVKHNSTNSFKIFKDGDVYLLTSYDTNIAEWDGEALTLDSKYHDYSTTTSRHLGDFLRYIGIFDTPKAARECDDTLFSDLNK